MTRKTKCNPWNIVIQVLWVETNSKMFHQPKKFMLTIFWDARGALYTEFLTKGSTVNSDRYCVTLRSLNQRIRRIRPERNTFLLHHDNARLHRSAQTQDAMTSLKFTVVPHPPYSPDLAPSDFRLLPKLKETLKGRHSSSDTEVEAAVRKWISIQPETFFMDGTIEKNV